MTVVKIITTDPEALKWKTLKEKLSTIESVLNTAKNANFKVEIEYRDLTPKVVDGKIDRKWFKDNVVMFGLADFFVFHMNLASKTKWGITPTNRGLRFNDGDDVGDLYIWANESTKRGRHNQFIETCLHEIRHELCFGLGLTDDTHTLHSKYGTLVNSFKKFDMATYQVKREAKKTALRKTLTEMVKSLLGKTNQPTTLGKRLPEKYNNYISQNYGVVNSSYKATGRHIGIDYACPIGTPIYAVWNGEVIVAGNSGDLGNFCYYRYVYDGKVRVERNLHLNSVPELGKYGRGEVIGYSGNTGMSTGPHYHIDGWWGEVKMGEINKTNWNKLTYNPKI
jgi:hypothetical protein